MAWDRSRQSIILRLDHTRFSGKVRGIQKRPPRIRILADRRIRETKAAPRCSGPDKSSIRKLGILRLAFSGGKNEEIGKFAQSLRGSLIGRDHGEYDEVRKLYNGMIDKRPLLIARCADVADVIAAVNFGRSALMGVPRACVADRSRSQKFQQATHFGRLAQSRREVDFLLSLVGGVPPATYVLRF
jgi:hypothetical protein